MATTQKSVQVTITSDLMCPWCWVGLRKLQEASSLADVNVIVDWKPFLLRPETPVEGVPKGGTPATRVGARLKAAGDAVGINFTGLTDRTPNTELFHATMKALHGPDQTRFQEEAFANYFTRGIFPDRQGLIDAAERAGLAEKVKTLYANTNELERLRRAAVDEALKASAIGISSVPTFAFNGRLAFSGARDAREIANYITQFAK